MSQGHASRKHSEFAPSGAERWTECPASVRLSRGLPESPDSPASIMGTNAHELLEALVRHIILGGPRALPPSYPNLDREAYASAVTAAKEIISIRKRRSRQAVLRIEQRVYARQVDAELYGSSDAIIFDPATRELDVIDFKNGMKFVSPERNLQLIIYALGAAILYPDFVRAHLWIIQPRLPNFTGGISWTIERADLLNYIDTLKAAIIKARSVDTKPKEGPWCFFCRAKRKCPAKTTEMFAPIK